MQPTSHLTQARHRSRAILLALSVLALAGGIALGPARSAQANEFVPKPVIDVLPQCWSTSPPSERFAITLSNQGLGSAHFVVVLTIDGVAQTETFDVGTVPATPVYFVANGAVPSLDITSTDGPGAHFHYDYQAIDCMPLPSGSIKVECPPVPGGQATLVYTYFNPSLFGTIFSATTPDGNGFTKQAEAMVAPETETVDVAEGTHVQVALSAEGKVVAALDTVVDCAPDTHTITVSKTVVGGTGNPSFSFSVVCGSPAPLDIVETFSLHDGESHVVTVPGDKPCAAHEVSPGAHWTPHVAVDGGAEQAGTDSTTLDTTTDHTVAFRNVEVPDYPLVVSKTVVNHTTTQAFPFTLDCAQKVGPNVVTHFSLADGDTQTFSLFGTTSCDITEADPGAGWHTFHVLDASSMADGLTQHVLSFGGHQVTFVNGYTPPSTTTTTTSTTTTSTTTSTTLPTVTVPDTTPESVPATTPETVPETTPETIPEVTFPDTTVPETIATVPMPPATEAVVVADTSVTSDPGVEGLARTGSDLAPLALLGGVLVGIGLLLLGVRRRQATGRS